jgi:hypothetical protein
VFLRYESGNGSVKNGCFRGALFFRFLFFLIILKIIATHSILLPTHSNSYYSNRPVLLFLTVPLPPIHFHSPSLHPRVYPPHSFYPLFLLYFLSIIQTIVSLPILPLPYSNHHHSNRADLPCRLVPLPPNHCHSPRPQLCLHAAQQLDLVIPAFERALGLCTTRAQAGEVWFVCKKISLIY